MPLTDHPDEVQAYLTDQARTYFARSVSGELYYNVIGFSVGRGGYNPLDPVHITPVNTAATTLDDQVYPDAIATHNAPFAEVDEVANSTLVFNCRLAATPIQTNADYALGEIGIWARINSATNPLEVGVIFLYSLGHMPIRSKTRRDVFLLRVVVNY